MPTTKVIKQLNAMEVNTKVIKPKAAEVTKAGLIKQNPAAKPRKSRAVNVKVSQPNTELLPGPSVRKTRASSCSRCTETQAACKPKPKPTRTRSSSLAPRIGSGLNLNLDPSRHTPTKNSKTSEVTKTTGIKTADTKYGIQSHKAFTVIPPDPKKRREIQRKAEAELAALEELRLSRAMAYVSIDPSTVGGCMSLEEVRSKQQKEMILAKRKPKPVKVLEQTNVLSS